VEGQPTRELLRRVWPLLREKLPLFALATASCVVTWLAQRETAASSLALVGFWPRLENAVVSYADYLAQTCYPVGLAPFYPLPIGTLSGARTWTSTAVLAAITAVAVAQARKRPYLLAGWLWYLGTLVPVIGLVQVGAQARADRYTYVPTVGIYLMAVWAADELAGRLRIRTAGFLLAACMVAVLTILCRGQVSRWRDDMSLWPYTLRVTGENWVARYGMAVAEEKAGEKAGAIQDYREAIRLNPNNAPLRARAGVAFHSMKRYDEARESYEEALKIDPRFAQVHANLGALLRTRGDNAEALTHLQKAVELEPDEPESAPAYFNLGVILQQQGHRDEAIAAYRHAVALDPSAKFYRDQLEFLLRSGDR
jgi:Tfp pilus assembly protein PilF